MNNSKKNKNLYLDRLNKIIGIRIMNRRSILQISRAELAEEIGITQQQLAKYESGVNRIPVGRLVLACDILSSSISYFVSNKF
ncbi:MAG: hypothetical protein DGJ47_000372 [Rickettsiaceae bacterium]